MRDETRLERLLVVLLAAALGASVLAACGASSAQGVETPGIVAGQSPIDTYQDSQANSAATPLASGTAKRRDGATAAELSRVHLLSVGLGAGGKYIAVNFKAPVKLARRWWPGMLYVVDERTHKLYDGVPTVAILGPLLGRPKVAGQTGYVMLVNKPPLAVGARVTVVLGSFKKPHIRIQ